MVLPHNFKLLEAKAALTPFSSVVMCNSGVRFEGSMNRMFTSIDLGKWSRQELTKRTVLMRNFSEMHVKQGIKINL